MEFLFVTGMSGGGKSHVARTLDDIGYYCIDNMPVMLLSKFIELYCKLPQINSRIAFIIDVRGEMEFGSLISEMNKIKQAEYKCSLIFLNCDDEVIINRYKETRRQHPLTMLNNISITQAIIKERDLLTTVKDSADFVIDTTQLNTAQLRSKIIAIINTISQTLKGLMITCMSFGFKHGIPIESDLVFDLRCFPNPFYITHLKDLTGIDEKIRQYLESHKNWTDFRSHLCSMLDFLVPQYIEEGRGQLIISCGCTGGKHRSVCMTEYLHEFFSKQSYNCIAVHRDIDKNRHGLN